jgi:type I restriction enzyme S subunit
VAEEGLRRAERLRQAVLRDAFAGKLVPQNPTEEPESGLPEGIRQKTKGGPRPPGAGRSR